LIRDYEDFKAEIYRLSSVDLNAYKERQMKRRINSLIRKKGHDSYDSYIKLLKEDKLEYEKFLTYLTINVSEFFRNSSQWEVLENEIFPYLFNRFSKSINIWSAACSTGDEPYSLAMIMSKYTSLNNINIIATDIDKQILDKARLGLYNDKAIASVPSEFKSKYFSKDGELFKITDDIKNCITFKQHNLLKDTYPKNLDLIVCRNVLIYFTEEAKNKIYEQFNRSLKIGGILFVGSTEQIIQSYKFGLEPIKSFFYKKIEDI